MCRHFLAIAISVRVLPRGLFAQSKSGAIVGFITDPSRVFVPKAKLVLVIEAKGPRRQATTNDSGYYVVPNLEPGL
jgi:hypothetical protein